MMERFLGIDLGAETLKVVELLSENGRLSLGRRRLVEHHKAPGPALREVLWELGWDALQGAAATGRVSRMLTLERVPTKAALTRGAQHAYPNRESMTIVSIGNHGFAVLELRGGDNTVWRENSRCSQGTGNFLRQLVERFDLTIEAASALCADVEHPAALSGRCPVILKTDMTHLANKGESRAAILAGLYDAVCENVQGLIRPTLAPPDVLLVGGVTRSSRVRAGFERFLTKNQMRLIPADPEDGLYLEALGAALVAAEHRAELPVAHASGLTPYGLPVAHASGLTPYGLPVAHASGLTPYGLPTLDAVFTEAEPVGFEQVPALGDAMKSVRRMPPVLFPTDGLPRRVVLGFDIGSTGSKVVAIDAATADPVWEGYVNTLGDPVGAARRLAGMFLEETKRIHGVMAVGTTGSGREIAGSLMSACFGGERVFVLNEIAAHSAGALHFDPEVDTIFEIGGQDAKYIRLDGGRICDAAMNEACSAGTGSFIAEQGGKFQEVADVAQMGRLAMDAEHGISLGQHCSVFMAEIIDEAVAAGVPSQPIVAGIYDSVVQNYLNRVKGSRSVGKRIFCQGMPFRADALAAAVARQTGRSVIVPPNPGTIGALGIALLAARELPLTDVAGLELDRFLTAEVLSKDTFVCKSTKGCGGCGNKCRIDRMQTRVAGHKQRFLWGGHCSLYDPGATHRRKLPDRAPDPFRQRQEHIDALVEKVANKRADGKPSGRPVVAVAEEFTLKGQIAFFATFVHELGFDVKVHTHAGRKSLERGIAAASIPWCAPMQLYHGVTAEMLDGNPDFLLVPRLRELPRQKDEIHACTCPIVQAAPDIVRRLADENSKTTIVTARVDMGPGNYQSDRFRETVRTLARELESVGRQPGGVAESVGRQPGGVQLDAEARFLAAYEAACNAQEDLDHALLRIGKDALHFAKRHNVVPVVVLGRAYTIYNDILNSNVPNLLREQGALAIPVDCYPVPQDVPVFNDMYWGYSQVNLRAAHQIRRSDGVYSIFCSNYSCGPDSFNLHFYSYIMENKPFAIIETDGHAGDAGTKTRIEAFLYCVEGDRRLARQQRNAMRRTNLKGVEVDKISLADARRREETVLIPRMGPSGEVVAALMEAEGFRAECLPRPTRDALRTGRRHTSGKECVPMTLTTGSLLERLEQDRATDERFAFFMPTACGPCRFGVYNMLHKIVLEKTGWKDRVRIISPSDQDYFAEVSTDFRIRALVGFIAGDLLLLARQDVGPVEREKGAAQALYERYFAELCLLVRNMKPRPIVQALGELGRGVFGIRDLLRRAAADFRAIKDFDRDVPTVSVVGEIYARLDPFANDFVVDKLEARGIRALVAPFHEWLEYTTYTELQRIRENRPLEGDGQASARFTFALEVGAMDRLYGVLARPLRWRARTKVEDTIETAAPYISNELVGEAILTLGGPLHEHEHGAIDGVVSVGPHECMPNKIAEAQFSHVGEERGLISLTVPLNGDPIDAEILDRFAFEVKERHARKAPGHTARVAGDFGTMARDLRRRAMVKALGMLAPLPAR